MATIYFRDPEDDLKGRESSTVASPKEQFFHLWRLRGMPPELIEQRWRRHVAEQREERDG